MIKRFEVHALFGKKDYNLVFDPQLNILTGKNGSGKTTILKLIWHCLSGNFESASEIPFRSATLETSEFKLVLSRDEIEDQSLQADIIVDGHPVQFESESANFWEIGSRNKLWQQKTFLSNLFHTSLYFPTFRRIEGGYSSGKSDNPFRVKNPTQDLQSALQDVSQSLSESGHRFVASISTNDVVDLLTRRFAEISEQTNRMHRRLSNSVRKTLRDYEQLAGAAGNQGERKLAIADEALNTIKSSTQQADSERNALLQPFLILEGLVKDIFQYRGIKISSGIFFGDSVEATLSEKLSAGEKQMLSFLCYNAFSSNCCIFIDEPEISLHVDWQRILFPKLLQQSTSNQFIIATHSPFIYSKYSDKELILNSDKGE